MARRDRDKGTTPEATATAEVPTSEESGVTATATEAPVETTEASATGTAEAAASTETPTETPTEAKAEKPAVDLTAFKAAVATAVAERDSSTGVVPEQHLAPVNAAYREIDGLAGKNAARKYLADEMKSAMNSMDIALARAYMLITESLSAGGSAKEKAERPPADPTEAYVRQVVALRLAEGLVQRGEGVAEDADQRVEALIAEVQGGTQLADYGTYLASEEEDKTEPEVNPVVKLAHRLATGKGLGKSGSVRAASTGERHDIGKHIQEAFADKPVGTFLTIAEIRKFKSGEYPEGNASAGAVAARLFPKSGKCTLEGIEPGQNESARKGAKRVEVAAATS